MCVLLLRGRGGGACVSCSRGGRRFVTLAVLGAGGGMPPLAVGAALLLLGATAGPIQPINAELAVEVSGTRTAM